MICETKEWEIKEEAGDKKGGNYCLTHKYKEEIQIIFSVHGPANKQYLTNSMAYGTQRFSAAFTRAPQ